MLQVTYVSVYTMFVASYFLLLFVPLTKYLLADVIFVYVK